MIQELDTIVSDVVMETEDSATIFLSTGEELPEYQAGQFLTVDPHQFHGKGNILFMWSARHRICPRRLFSTF